MKLTGLTLLVLLLSFLNNVHSQNPTPKFGKIDAADLQLAGCPIDSNAHAFFLFDTGQTEFKYNTTEDKGFQLYFNRHLRIKILDSEGFSLGDFRIPLYHNSGSKEEVTAMKAFTYNLEKDKIIKTKLERSDMLTEETSGHIETLKFAMPNVKEGSVIEIEYTVKSDFLFNLQEWYFQRTIPTLYSEYNVYIPEYFVYNQAQHGYYPIKNNITTKNQSITFTYKERTGDRVTTTQTSTEKVDYRETCYQYLASNVPAFPDEKFLKTKDNYLSRVKFELQSTKFPNSPFKTFTTTWEEVDRELNESYSFGKELNKTGHLDDDVKLIKAGGLQGEDLINAALTHMKKRVSWDGTNSKYLSSTLGKAYKTGRGNAADVNLNLVGLLRELGFQSHPVILSTRQNGIIHPAHPSLTSFNYVIALVTHNNTSYLLDATDPYSMLNLLPVRCLNDKGRIIGEPAEKWINLMDYKTYVATASYEMTLDSNLSLIGKVKKQMAEYGAYEYRSSIKESDDTEKAAKKMEENSGFTVDDIKISGLDSLSNNLAVMFNLSKSDGTNASGEMVYFAPGIDPFFDENPFKLEKREFPVEFNYPYRIQQVYTYKIPENYEITEVPKPVAIKLPKGYGNFYFQTSKMGNTIMVSSMISIRNSLFLPDEYELLKKFFQSIIDKQNEFILLKSI